MTNEKFDVREALIADGRSNCIEFDEFLDSMDEHPVYYIDFDSETNELYCGTACNVGIFKDYSIQYDYDLSLDENLQNLYNFVIENHDDDIRFVEED